MSLKWNTKAIHRIVLKQHDPRIVIETRENKSKRSKINRTSKNINRKEAEINTKMAEVRHGIIGSRALATHTAILFKIANLWKSLQVHKMAESQLGDIVRCVVSSLRNLPNDGTNASTSSIRSEHHSNSVEHELAERFRIPGVPDAPTSARSLPRSGRGRFVPYTAKSKKGKSKEKSAVELVMKNVCLLPTPNWNEVPRRQIKEDLVRRNFFIDAWTLDKSWSEEELRAELFNLFKDKLSNPNE